MILSVDYFPTEKSGRTPVIPSKHPIKLPVRYSQQNPSDHMNGPLSVRISKLPYITGEAEVIHEQRVTKRARIPIFLSSSKQSRASKAERREKVGGITPFNPQRTSSSPAFKRRRYLMVTSPSPRSSKLSINDEFLHPYHSMSPKEIRNWIRRQSPLEDKQRFELEQSRMMEYVVAGYRGVSEYYQRRNEDMLERFQRIVQS